MLLDLIFESQSPFELEISTVISFWKLSCAYDVAVMEINRHKQIKNLVKLKNFKNTTPYKKSIKKRDLYKILPQKAIVNSGFFDFILRLL